MPRDCRFHLARRAGVSEGHDGASFQMQLQRAQVCVARVNSFLMGTLMAPV